VFVFEGNTNVPTDRIRCSNSRQLAACTLAADDGVYRVFLMDESAAPKVSAAEARRQRILARSKDRLTQITGTYSTPETMGALQRTHVACTAIHGLHVQTKRLQEHCRGLHLSSQQWKRPRQLFPPPSQRQSLQFQQVLLSCPGNHPLLRVNMVDAGSTFRNAGLKLPEEVGTWAAPVPEPSASDFQPRKSEAGVVGEIVLASHASAAVRVATAVLLAILVTTQPGLTQGSAVTPLAAVVVTQVRPAVASSYAP
jgi:hypothetical protein